MRSNERESTARFGSSPHPRRRNFGPGAPPAPPGPLRGRPVEMAGQEGADPRAEHRRNDQCGHDRGPGVDHPEADLDLLGVGEGEPDPECQQHPGRDQPEVPAPATRGRLGRLFFTRVMWNRHGGPPLRVDPVGAMVPLLGGLQGFVPTGSWRWRPMAEGHQLSRPKSVTVAGTSTVRTTKVSNKMPTASPKPTDSMELPPGWRAETTANTANVPASTNPAEVTVDPVAPTAFTTAWRRGNRAASSRIRDMTRML